MQVLTQPRGVVVGPGFEPGSSEWQVVEDQLTDWSVRHGVAQIDAQVRVVEAAIEVLLRVESLRAANADFDGGASTATPSGVPQGAHQGVPRTAGGFPSLGGGGRGEGALSGSFVWSDGNEKGSALAGAGHRSARYGEGGA